MFINYVYKNNKSIFKSSKKMNNIFYNDDWHNNHYKLGVTGFNKNE